MNTDAREIIQEALEVAYDEQPKTFLDRFFHREPSEKKLKSSAIWYLTERIQKEQDKAIKAKKEADQIIRFVLREAEQYSPELTRKIYKYLATYQK